MKTRSHAVGLFLTVLGAAVVLISAVYISKEPWALLGLIGVACEVGPVVSKTSQKLVHTVAAFWAGAIMFLLQISLAVSIIITQHTWAVVFLFAIAFIGWLIIESTYSGEQPS